ncbi:tRNA(Ile)-lysidine synthase [Bacteroidia bacterium]|nr:tRNA(Ile)-lysidine synthase [Bacteroidia bacterium]
MFRKVRNYIAEQNLLPAGKSLPKVIVGLSGGADSVVLLYILNRLGYECLAAHCNFHLRGEEALRDELFAIDLAVSWNIPVYKQNFDTQAVAKQRGISIEMAARDLRYEWFEQLRKEHQAEAIAVAHHQDDTIETLLLNLIRGTGLRGLTGIQPKNGKVVRPLLCVSKKEILAFAEKNQLPFITDSSNLQENYTRNKIRLSLIPLLQSLNPSVHSALLRTMENLHEIEKIYDFYIQQSKSQVFDNQSNTIAIPLLKNLPSSEAVLFEILRMYGFGTEVIRDAYRAVDSQAGKEFYSPEYTLIRDRNQFLLVSNEEKPVEIQYKMEIVENSPDFEIRKDKNTAYFDADKLQQPLTVRKWQKGDKFVPFGMNGFQKVSDYFNNHQFSKPQKEQTRLLCSGEDIIWIIGHRTDNRYRVGEQTRKIAIVIFDSFYL